VVLSGLFHQWRHLGGGEGGHLPLSDFISDPNGRCPVVAVLSLLYAQKHAYFIIFSENIILCTKKLFSQ